MTKRWRQDAKDILIFVSGPVVNFTATYTNCSTTDRSILCGCFRATHRIRPRPQTEFSRYFRILSSEHLSGSRRSKRHRITHIYPFHSRHTAPILSSEIRHLGEFTLVFDPSDQPHVCSLGHIVTSMVTSIHQFHSAATICTTEASAIALVFSWGHGQDASSVDS